MKAGYKTPRLELAALRRREYSLQKSVDHLDTEIVMRPEVMPTLENTLKQLAECKDTIARFLDIHTQLT
jgi:hypothetical protein